MKNNNKNTILSKQVLDARVVGLEIGKWRNNKNEVIELKDQPVTYLYNIYKMILRSADDFMHEVFLDDFIRTRRSARLDIPQIAFPASSELSVVLHTPELYTTVIYIKRLLQSKGKGNLLLDPNTGIVDPAP